MSNYAHSTTDLWEAVALHACGWPIIATSHNERDEVVFEFVNGGDSQLHHVQAHQRGDLKINSLAMKSSYHAVRSVLGSGARRGNRV